MGPHIPVEAAEFSPLNGIQIETFNTRDIKNNNVNYLFLAAASISL